MSNLQRFRTDIQGLRALAIIPVLLFHSYKDWMPGGFVGVDIFFVISGYLITRIILKEIGENRYSVLGFYQRRVVRLFPALFILLVATFLAGVVTFPPQQLAALGSSAVAALLFVANLFYLRTTDYFGQSAEYLPLIHTWSLAVEEQFYIAFPLLVYLLRKKPRVLLITTCVIAGISLLMCIYVLGISPKAAFYLPFTRAYELLIGALVAIGLSNWSASQRTRDVLSLIGILLLIYCFATFSEATRFPGLSAILPCLGAALIILAGQDGDSLGGRLISHPILLFFGNISYSLYLWHWPVLTFGRYWNLGPLSPWQALALLAFSVLCAWLSYRFVERPIINARVSAGRAFASAGAGSALVVSICMAFILSAGLPGRFGSPAIAAMKQAESSYSPRRADCHFHFGKPFEYSKSCVLGAPDTQPVVAVWSDSYGAELSYVLGQKLATQGESVRELSASECSPGLDEASAHESKCTRFNRLALAGLVSESSIRVVVIVAHYLAYPVDPDALAKRLERDVKILRAAGKQVVLVFPVPTPRFDLPVALAMANQFHLPLDKVQERRTAFTEAANSIDSRLNAILSSSGARSIKPDELLCNQAKCPVLDTDGAPLYFDDRHLSLRGIELLLDRQDVIPNMLDTHSDKGKPASAETTKERATS